jgi:hypothetical protein
MEDLSYLVPESAKAWLDGGGDGRFESYERYYRRALRRDGDSFEVTTVNERFETYVSARGRASASRIGNLIIGMTLIGFGLYVSGKVVVTASDFAPKSTGAIMLAGIVALKVFQRKQRKAALKK